MDNNYSFCFFGNSIFNFPRSIFKVLRSISTRTGVAPTCKIVLIVEQKVNGVVITSSPFFILRDIKDKCKAAVHEFTASENEFFYN